MHNLSSQEASQTLAAYNINLKKNETIIMKDSGSNTHLVTQRDIPTLGMPDLVKKKSGRLNGPIANTWHHPTDHLTANPNQPDTHSRWQASHNNK